MREMTLPSRHRIRNPGGLRLSTLPLGHGGSPMGPETLQIFHSFRFERFKNICDDNDMERLPSNTILFFCCSENVKLEPSKPHRVA